MSAEPIVERPGPSAKRWKAGGTEGRPKGRDAWRTPPELFDQLDRMFGFTVDVASSSENAMCPLSLALDRGHDAFLEDWGPRGSVAWCNPPYSNLRPWLDRAVLQARAGRTVVVLLPSDTSTRYWAEVVAQFASQVIFLVGRVRFLRPDGTDHRTVGGGGGITSPSAAVVFDAYRLHTCYSYLKVAR